MRTLMLLSLLVFIPVANAANNKCMDKDGNVLITDEPCSTSRTPGMTLAPPDNKPKMTTPPAEPPKPPPPLPATQGKSAAQPVRQ